MITLNSDRGFVKVETWAEVEELPGFTSELNPKEHDLKDIIGRYIFKDYIKCGLSSCHTPHGKGYVVSTKSGPITNIGRDCGKTHFDVEFEEMSKSFERDVQLHNYRENIGGFLIVLDLHKQSISNIRNGADGADALFKKGQSLIKRTSGCPEEAVSICSRMIRSRDPSLLVTREATPKEIEDLEAIQGVSLQRPYYHEEKIGELKGLSFLYEENDLRNLLIVDLEEGLKAVSKIDLDNESFKDLKHWSVWCSDVERKIELARTVLEAGRMLIDKKNLLQIEGAITNPEQRKEYVRFIDKNI